jgi:ribosomal-protein-alanine N-acetyltransferase
MCAFKLRPWNMDDVDSLVQHANNWNVARFMTDNFPYPYTPEHGRNFIEFACKDNPIHIFAIDIEGVACGGIGKHPQNDIHRKNAELGYWLAEPFWGQGIISRAIAQMVQFAFKTYDVERVFARPFGTNTASQRVLEKNQFILEARLEKVLIKDGKMLDELIYAVRRNWYIPNT